MGRGYSVTGPTNAGAAPQTMVVVTASNLARPALFEWIIGSTGTPADYSSTNNLQRFSAAGTTTSVVPAPLDPGSVASVTTAGYTATVEPTYTANTKLVSLPLNMRASFRWVANPGYELLCPATNANGVGAVQTVSSTTFTANSDLFFFE